MSTEKSETARTIDAVLAWLAGAGEDLMPVGASTAADAIKTLQSKLAAANQRAERAEKLVAQGLELSEYAAAIHFNADAPNTQEWLDGLADRIENFQGAVQAQAGGEGK